MSFLFSFKKGAGVYSEYDHETDYLSVTFISRASQKILLMSKDPILGCYRKLFNRGDPKQKRVCANSVFCLATGDPIWFTKQLYHCLLASLFIMVHRHFGQPFQTGALDGRRSHLINIWVSISGSVFLGYQLSLVETAKPGVQSPDALLGPQTVQGRH